MRTRCAASALAFVVFLTPVLGAPDASAQPAHSGAPKAEGPATPKAKKPGATAQAKKPAAKHDAKPSAKAPKKGGKKPLARKPGSDPGEPDEATRRIIAGTA